MSFETIDEVVVNCSESSQVRVSRKESSTVGPGIEMRKWLKFPAMEDWRPTPKGIFVTNKVFITDIMPILKRYEESIRNL